MIAYTREESLKKCGVIASTLMLRAVKAAKHTPDTPPMIVVSQRLVRMCGRMLSPADFRE
ncbi:MAG: hypothetical protein ACR2IF_08105 [Terriglobales bacterium]